MGFAPRKRQIGPVAAYIRVSSRGQGYATQRAAIEQAVEARGDQVHTWYAEKRSGATLKRRELERLRIDVRAGRVRKLYIFRLDRLTRSGIRDTLQLVEELRGNGCELVTVSDGFDLGGPAAEIILAVMAWASKVERQAINERIAAARDRLEAAGENWGRPRRMTLAQLRRARRLRDEGQTIRQIAVALKMPKESRERALNEGAAEITRCQLLPP